MLARGPAHIRYLVRRLRRILPEGTAILVAFFDGEGGTNAVKELLADAEADAYAASLQEAAEIAIAAAKGELKIDEAGEAAAAPSRYARQRPGACAGRSQSDRGG